jgi:hypothetical protein
MPGIRLSRRVTAAACCRIAISLSTRPVSGGLNAEGNGWTAPLLHRREHKHRHMVEHHWSPVTRLNLEVSVTTRTFSKIRSHAIDSLPRLSPTCISIHDKRDDLRTREVHACGLHVRFASICRAPSGLLLCRPNSPPTNGPLTSKIPARTAVSFFEL